MVDMAGRRNWVSFDTGTKKGEMIFLYSEVCQDLAGNSHRCLLKLHSVCLNTQLQTVLTFACSKIAALF